MFIIGVIVINLIIMQIQALLDTLELQALAGSKGHFALYNCLVLGKTKYKGLEKSAAGVLQPLSEETVLLQPQAGPGHDSSAWYRARGVRGLA
jgi:hypothetical protein